MSLAVASAISMKAMPDKLKFLRHGGMGVVVSGTIRKLSVCSPASKMA